MPEVPRNLSIDPEIAEDITDKPCTLWIIGKNQVDVYCRTMKDHLGRYIPESCVIRRASPCVVHSERRTRNDSAIITLRCVLPNGSTSVRSGTIINLKPGELVSKCIIDGVVRQFSNDEEVDEEDEDSKMEDSHEGDRRDGFSNVSSAWEWHAVQLTVYP